MSEYKVLMVDDEQDFLNTFQKRLRRRKVEVDAVTCGEDALEYMENNSPDIVILDVKMPGMDGITVLNKIKQKYPLVEVILLTGHANMEVAAEGMEIGAFDYVLKPASLDELMFKIEDAYKRKILQEEKINTMKNHIRKQKKEED
ncbi:MAG: response regulator [Desulfobacteraceae bacterium]|nr:response regulator [Desulfobacteraceae bacterium]